MRKLIGLILWLQLFFSGFSWAAEQVKSPVKVLVSIPPLALIAEEIYGQKVEVLLRGASSPHHSVLLPSDLLNIAKADLIFWIGPELEPFLVKAMRNKPQVALKGAIAEKALSDSHIWLDPELAAKIAEVMAQKMTENHPERKAEVYQRLESFQVALLELDQSLHQQFKNVAPFVIFHDSLKFWVERYKLPQLAALTDVPEEAVGLKTLASVASVNDSARCLLSEPGESHAAKRYAERLRLPLVEVDILATQHPHASYVDFILYAAKSVKKCAQGNTFL